MVIHKCIENILGPAATGGLATLELLYEHGFGLKSYCSFPVLFHEMTGV